MKDWSLKIAFHWPHDRLALGWESMRPDEEHVYSTIVVYFFIVTFELDYL